MKRSLRPTIVYASSALLLAFGGLGCGPQPDDGSVFSDPVTGNLSSSNGFTLNGFTLNGFTLNGFTLNGFTLNGFTLNGFTLNGSAATTSGFAGWFSGATQADAANHGSFMKYFVGCALPAGQSVSYTDVYGTTWTWSGVLGLAPEWATTPSSLTEAENQLLTACMAAHVNAASPEPKHIQISLRGSHPNLAVTEQERSALSTFDGVFFGNVFKTAQSDARLYLCAPKDAPPSNYVAGLLNDWGRQCYYSSDGCHGLFTIVDCTTACGAGTDGAPFGTTCTVGGVSYKAISVRVPKIKKASDFTPAGVTFTTCASCLGGKALMGFSSPSAVATASGMTTAAGAGSYLLDLRYLNNSTATAYLTLQVVDPAKGTTTTVMNGTSTKFAFGSATTIKQLTIPVTLPNNATLKLVGALGSTAQSSLAIESAILRMP
jgi:hypothetical protein